MPTIQETINLVKSNIKWFRKWTDDMPTYTHSIRVYEMLKKYWFSEVVQRAGLLHDIIEDGGFTFDDLRNFWESEEVINLVDLSSHDLAIEDSFDRWKNMLERLMKEENKDARAIKLADISDNLSECHLMPNKRKLERFLMKKCPVFVYYGNKYFAWTEFYNEFLERYYKQIKEFNQYFIK